MASDRPFSLKGYVLPLSPEGKASLIDPPPWHFGGDVMHLIFKADEKKVKALLPPGVGDKKAGDANIRFMPSDFEEVANLGPIEPMKGFFFQVGITITGGTVIYRYR